MLYFITDSIMAKLQNPFNSFRAQGSIRRALTVRRSARRHIAEKFPNHPDANTAPQQAQRLMFQMCADLWHTLSATEQKIWESTARPFHMTGYAYYLSQCLKPNPGIYLPLAGGTMQGVIGMDSNRITDLPAPVGNADPSRKQDLTTHAALASGVHDLAGLRMFSVVQTSDQTITTGTVTVIDYDTKEVDIGTCFNLTTDKHTPDLEGYYHYSACARLKNFADASIFVIALYKNGVLARQLGFFHGSHATAMSGGGAATLYMNGSTDYAQIVVFQNTGASQDTDGQSGRVYFQGFLIPQS